MKSEIIETRSCELWLDEDNIINIVFKKDVELTLEDAVELLEIRKKLLRGGKGPSFADVRNLKSDPKEVRDFAKTEESARTITAYGILVGSPISRMLGSFFLGVNIPPYPARLFTSKVEAMEWLKGFL